jgi:hypothetical protein
LFTPTLSAESVSLVRTEGRMLIALSLTSTSPAWMPVIDVLACVVSLAIADIAKRLAAQARPSTANLIFMLFRAVV